MDACTAALRRYEHNVRPTRRNKTYKAWSTLLGEAIRQLEPAHCPVNHLFIVCIVLEGLHTCPNPTTALRAITHQYFCMKNQYTFGFKFMYNDPHRRAYLEGSESGRGNRTSSPFVRLATEMIRTETVKRVDNINRSSRIDTASGVRAQLWVN